MPDNSTLGSIVQFIAKGQESMLLRLHTSHVWALTYLLAFGFCLTMLSNVSVSIAGLAGLL